MRLKFIVLFFAVFAIAVLFTFGGFGKLFGSDDCHNDDDCWYQGGGSHQNCSKRCGAAASSWDFGTRTSASCSQSGGYAECCCNWVKCNADPPGHQPGVPDSCVVGFAECETTYGPSNCQYCSDSCGSVLCPCF